MSRYSCVYLDTIVHTVKHATRLIHMSDATHTYVWHYSCVYLDAIVHSKTHHTNHPHVRRDPYMCVTLLMCIPRCYHQDSDRKGCRKRQWKSASPYISRYSCVYLDAIIHTVKHDTRLIHMSDATRTYVWHYSYICVTLLKCIPRCYRRVGQREGCPWGSGKAVSPTPTRLIVALLLPP